MHILIVEPALTDVVADPLEGAALHQRLETAVPGATFEYLMSQGELADSIPSADVVAGPRFVGGA